MANQVLTASDGKVSVVDPTGKVVYSYYPGGTGPGTGYTTTPSSQTMGTTYTQGDNVYDSSGKVAGTVQYDSNTGKKLSTGQSFSLPTTTAPTNLSQIGDPMSSPTMPTSSPTTYDIFGAMGASSGLKSYYDTQAQILQDQQRFEESLRQQIAKTDSGKAESGLLSKLLNRQSPTEIRQEAFKETGIDPKKYFAEQKARIAELETLNKEYNNVKMQVEEQKAAALDKYATNNFINNQQAQIDRNAAPKLNMMSANINAKVATMQAIEGNYQEALKYVNMAIDAATEEYRYNLDMYSMFKEQNAEMFERIAKPYQQAYDLKLSMVEQAYKDQRAEKEQMGDLLLSAAKEGVDLSSYMTGSLEEMMQAYSSGVSRQTLIDKADSGSVTSSSGYRFTSTQLNKGSSNSGLSLDSFKSLPGEVQNFFVNLSATQAGEIRQVLSDVQSGELSANEAMELFDGLALSPEVSNYFQNIIGTGSQSAPTKTPLFGNPFEGSGNIIQNFWSNLKGFFN